MLPRSLEGIAGHLRSDNLHNKSWIGARSDRSRKYWKGREASYLSQQTNATIKCQGCVRRGPQARELSHSPIDVIPIDIPVIFRVVVLLAEMQGTIWHPAFQDSMLTREAGANSPTSCAISAIRRARSLAIGNPLGASIMLV
jgi:hypothetical protein